MGRMIPLSKKIDVKKEEAIVKKILPII